MKKLLTALFIAALSTAQAQYWQQEVAYTMDIDVDAATHSYTGSQKVVYTNNSPDTLTEVYFHLYFNAFQPESMMDVRSRTIKDPDRRVGSRIAGLAPDEIGYQKVDVLNQEGQPLSYEVYGTVLKASLAKAVLPGESTWFEMNWAAQVPKQIRRSGWNNKEGIELTMTQWYPKLAEYDGDGWHADQYVGREFYGVWGSFDVRIHIDPKYLVAGTGTLQNKEQIGMGYGGIEKAKRVKRGEKRTWHFQAADVHDFAFAADPDYIHEELQIENGPVVHLVYDPKTANEGNWQRLKEGYLQGYFDFMAEHFGKYPYDQFSIIQGGDGGMEYPMCTMILGGGDNFEGFTGLFVHEATHNWYYGVMATNEVRHPWMDEGFTTYAEEKCMAKLFNHNGDPFAGSYRNFVYLDTAGHREPLSTPGDHFNYNMVYGINSYSAGALFLNQLEYVVGEGAFARGMKRYWNAWSFKHPTPSDFIRIMERESGLHLDWYLSYYKDQVKSIDYTVAEVVPVQNGATITLERIGKFPMPIDLKITLDNGQIQHHTIPLLSMYGAKAEAKNIADPWPWTHPTYTLQINTAGAGISKVEIDPTNRLVDIDRSNNTWSAQ
ncbi:MAG: hypothetical protein RL754_708 [Bacteroidota bacterium]